MRGLARDGRPLDYVAAGFEARIVQHEFDHLNAVVFLDRMRDFKSLAFYDEWERFMVRGAGDADDAGDADEPREGQEGEEVIDLGDGDEGEDELFESPERPKPGVSHPDPEIL